MTTFSPKRARCLPPIKRRGSTSRASSAISTSTNFRIPTPCSSTSSRCSRACTATSLWWATTTSPSTAGGGRRSKTSCTSSALTRAPRPSNCSRTTVRRKPSSRSRTRPSRTTSTARARSCGRRTRKERSPYGTNRTRRRARRCMRRGSSPSSGARATSSPTLPCSCASTRSRAPSSRNSPSTASPTRCSAASASSNARRSRTRSPTCASFPTRSTARPFRASSTCRGGASAKRRWRRCAPMRKERNSPSTTPFSIATFSPSARR